MRPDRCGWASSRLRSLAAWFLAIGFIGAGWAQEREPDGGFRFAHQAADAPLVDVLIDGRAVFRDVGFGSVTSYVPLAPRAHEITVVPHRLRQAQTASESSSEDGGSDASTQDRTLERVTTFLTVGAGSYHTAVLTGFYEPPVEDRELGQLSIAVTPEGTPFRISGPRGYAEEFTGDQLLTEIQPGTYTITADREGYSAATYEADVSPRSTTTVSIALQEGEDAAEQDPNVVGPTESTDTWVTLQVQTFEDLFGGIPVAGTARVRVVHVSPTSPRLQLLAQSNPDGSSAADGASETEGAAEAEGASETEGAAEVVDLGTLTYPAAGAYVAVPAGRYALRFEARDSDQSLFHLEDVDLAAGAVYTFFLTSEPSGARPRVVPTVDAVVMVDEAAP